MSKNLNGPTAHGKKVTRIILSQLTRIGDRVEMAVQDDDTEVSWRMPLVKNGMQGTVIGYGRYERWYGPVGIGAGDRVPGKYQCNGSLIVKWDDGQTDRPNPHYLVFVDPVLTADRHGRPGQSEYDAAFKTEEFMEPLPAFPFTEGDLVVAHKALWEPGELLKISNINYRYIGEVRTDGSPMPLYDVTPAKGGGGSISVGPEEIQLVRRGLIWTWMNDRANIKFESLEEEAELHKQFGLCDQVRNATTGSYHWPAEHVLAAAKSGEIDALAAVGGFFGSTGIVGAYKFRDPELGSRVRAKLVEGFSQ